VRLCLAQRRVRLFVVASSRSLGRSRALDSRTERDVERGLARGVERLIRLVGKQKRSSRLRGTSLALDHGQQ